MTWWIWFIVGFVLLVLEMLVPGGLVMLFFGVGALLTGFLTAFGIADAEWLQWLCFGLISIVLLVGLRKKAAHSRFFKGKSGTVDEMVGESCLCVQDIPVNGVGRVEYRGATWNARSAGSVAISKGTRCVIEQIDDLTLIVRVG